MKQAIPPSTIKIFLANGLPDGIRVIQKTGWNGSAVVSSRLQLPEALKREEFGRSGVYLLMSRDADECILYIGETDDLGARITQHATQGQNKDFFTEIVVFTSLDNSLNKAHIGYIESELIRLAKTAKQWDVRNKKDPNAPNMSEMDEAEAKAFLEEMLLIYPILGIDAFELPSQAVTKEMKSELLYLNERDAEGRGHDTIEGFIVLKDSIARLKATSGAEDWIKRERKELIAKGVLIPHSAGYQFTQDFKFSSPSRASAILVGGASNGRLSWKNEQGLPLKEIQDRAIESA